MGAHTDALWNQMASSLRNYWRLVAGMEAAQPRVQGSTRPNQPIWPYYMGMVPVAAAQTEGAYLQSLNRFDELLERFLDR